LPAALIFGKLSLIKMKKRVLLTGASGSMGHEAFKELLKRRDEYDIVLLLIPSSKKRIEEYSNINGVSVVWGDIRNPADVVKAVEGVDHVLHPAALIAPQADQKPLTCRNINFGGTSNLVTAIKKQQRDIKLVYISSVAVYGDRLPPIHMLQVGDPIKPSVGDVYATTKIAAERAIIESGLNQWAILRQTYIAIPDVMSLLDPILFHQPLNTHLELITNEDAGYGLVQALEAPDEFYGQVFNMSGGPSCRVVFSDYLAKMMQIFGLGDYRKIMDLNWFATRNFHCGWYGDSEKLNGYLHHWRHSLEDHYRQAEESIPWYVRVGGKIAPSSIVRAVIKRYADPLKWIKHNETEKIKAFFESREDWSKIPGWDGYNEPPPSSTEIPSYLQKTLNTNSLNDMKELALWRGGQCLSREFKDPKTKMRWKCGLGHEFEATPRLLLAGHWCPDCTQPPWDYDTQAKTDPALASMYYLNHSRDEYQKVEWLHCPNDQE
jgi:nucleoside-diphosphate-sugar epimerase